MKKITDLTGKRFGRLVVLSMSTERTPSGRVKWDCICDCGTEKSVNGCDMKSGKIVSCGCYRVEQHAKASSLAHTTHGLRASQPRFYNIWKGMVRRCTNPKMQNYPYYGGRGIQICDDWMDISNFATDMLDGYLLALANGVVQPSIERINNNGNYCKENCCWIPMSDQGKNKRPYKKRIPD